MTYPSSTHVQTARTATEPERLRMLAWMREPAINDALRHNPLLPTEILMDLPSPSAWDDERGSEW